MYLESGWGRGCTGRARKTRREVEGCILCRDGPLFPELSGKEATWEEQEEEHSNQEEPRGQRIWIFSKGVGGCSRVRSQCFGMSAPPQLPLQPWIQCPAGRGRVALGLTTGWWQGSACSSVGATISTSQDPTQAPFCTAQTGAGWGHGRWTLAVVSCGGRCGPAGEDTVPVGLFDEL